MFYCSFNRRVRMERHMQCCARNCGQTDQRTSIPGTPVVFGRQQWATLRPIAFGTSRVHAAAAAAACCCSIPGHRGRSAYRRPLLRALARACPSSTGSRQAVPGGICSGPVGSGSSTNCPTVIGFELMMTESEPSTPKRNLLRSIKKLFWTGKSPAAASSEPQTPPRAKRVVQVASPIASSKESKHSWRFRAAAPGSPAPEPISPVVADGENPVLFSPTYHLPDDEELPDDHHAHSHIHHHEAEKSISVDEPDNEPSYSDEGNEFCPWRFIKGLPHVDTVKMTRPLGLPGKSLVYQERMTLVLDLDETLVHCSIEPIDKSELTFPVSHCGQNYEVHVRRRPFFAEFCEAVSQWFEIIVFTASQRVYADKLLDILDPEGRYFQHRLFRDHCHFHEGNYLKDLRVLNRDLSRVAIVDNSVQAFGLHLDNGIPVESWFHEDNDEELMRLLPFLKSLQEHPGDVRPQIRQQFKLQELIDSL